METLWQFMSIVNITGLIGIVVTYFINRKKDSERQILQFKYEVIGRSFLPLFTAIDQFCFQSYLIWNSEEYTDKEWMEKHNRVTAGRPPDEKLLKERHALEEYCESLKNLKISILKLFESGIPVVISDFDNQAYSIIKGTLPFYLSLPTEKISLKDVGQGHEHLRQCGVWLQKRIHIDKLAREYQRVINSGLLIGIGIDEEEYKSIKHKFDG
ncbi:MAG TPA: hypothetical protein VG097_10655 [Gemmata sp.]|jgi:hypothetical protein|nr:hypothetical protein [Gemmata sp.]